MSVDVKTWKKINVLLLLSLGGIGKKKVVGCAQVLQLLPVLVRHDRLDELRRVHANKARILWSPLGSGRADRSLLILILSVAVMFQPHCPVPNSCSLPFPLLSMDSKQATRKVSGQASWLVRVICNRKKIVRKNKDFLQFFSQKIVTNIVADPGSRIRCFFGIRDPGWVKNQVRIRNTVIFLKNFSSSYRIQDPDG
jgi:hypothetical protein